MQNRIYYKIAKNNKNDFNKFDFLIIDEAQDLFTKKRVECFDKLLKNGLKDGNWYIALDEKQNIYNIENKEELKNEIIKIEKLNPVICTLNENCRNTKQIKEFNENFTNILQKDVKCNTGGYNVKIEKYKTKEVEREKVKGIIKHLKEEKTDNKDIVLLSKYKEGNNKNIFAEPNEKEKKKGYTKNINKDLKDFLKGYKGIDFYTIQGFKGLESKVVILCDVDDTESEYAKTLNYIAISRAKSLLYILQKEN